MPTTANTSHEIEIAALKGKAMAVLLGLACGTGDLSQDDIEMAAYAIEGQFLAILEALQGRPGQ
jgi:hypothetical protein